MFDWFRNIFKKKEPITVHPLPLTVEGIAPAPLTPEPDEAELAAAALIESLTPGPSPKGEGSDRSEPEKGTAEYYRHLADNIRQAHEDARLRTVRFLAYCEEQLNNVQCSMFNVQSLEAELYKHIDVVERHGGELYKRWQRCIAEITLRQLNIEH